MTVLLLLLLRWMKRSPLCRGDRRKNGQAGLINSSQSSEGRRQAADGRRTLAFRTGAEDGVQRGDGGLVSTVLWRLRKAERP